MINDLKKVSKNQIVSKSDTYGVYLGTFFDNAFTWYLVKEFKDLTAAYKEFKKYVNTQLKYTDEELVKVWDTGRLDIELRQGSKLLNWVGIYCREAKPLSEKEEKEVEKGKVDKPKAKDSLSGRPIHYKNNNLPAEIQPVYDDIIASCKEVCEEAGEKFSPEGFQIHVSKSPHDGSESNAVKFDYVINVWVIMNNVNKTAAKNEIYDKLYHKGYTLSSRRNPVSFSVYF